MKKSIILTITLLLLSLTASYAQSGNDSIVCYTQSELARIANKMFKANECDTLLKISEQQLGFTRSQVDALMESLSGKQQEVNAQKDILILFRLRLLTAK